METQGAIILASCEEEGGHVLVKKIENINNELEDYFLVSNVEKKPQEIIIIENEDESSKISQMCRTCATINDHLIPIFKTEGLEHDLCSKIHKHLPIKVCEDDKLPLQVCYHCAGVLLAFNELSEGVLTAQNRLLRLQNQAEQRRIHDNENESVENSPIEQFRAELLTHEDPKNPQSSSNETDRSSRVQTRFKTFLDNVFWRRRTEAANSSWINETIPIFDQQSVLDQEASLDQQNPLEEASLENSFEEASLDQQNPLEGASLVRQNSLEEASLDQQNPLEGASLVRQKFLLQQNSLDYQASLNHQRSLHQETSLDHKKSLSLDHQSSLEESLDQCEPIDFEESKLCIDSKEEEYDLSGEMEADSESEELNWKCKSCSLEFSSAAELNSHAKIHKSSEIRVPHQCPECGRSFKLKDSYLRHTRIHKDERPFTCHVCGKQFRDSGGLSRHLKDVHAKLKKFPCDLCGSSFASKATRDDHRRTHTGERPYVCDCCGKTFKSKASLYIHSKLHTDEFPHPCTYCSKKFRRKQEMLAHVTTHTGEKNFVCDVCSKRFRVKSELMRHRLIHSDNKPFACNKCGLAFRQKRYLNNHVKSRHFEIGRN